MALEIVKKKVDEGQEVILFVDQMKGLGELVMNSLRKINIKSHFIDAESLDPKIIA